MNLSLSNWYPGSPGVLLDCIDSLSLHAGESDYRLFDSSDLKTYILMRWYGPDDLAVSLAHRGLPVGFILLQYSSFIYL